MFPRTEASGTVNNTPYFWITFLYDCGWNTYSWEFPNVSYYWNYIAEPKLWGPRFAHRCCRQIQGHIGLPHIYVQPASFIRNSLLIVRHVIVWAECGWNQWIQQASNARVIRMWDGNPLRQFFSVSEPRTRLG